MAAGGCAYGKVTRQMVLNIKEDVKDIKDHVEKLSNHYSKRLPHWATAIITILTTICGMCIVALLK
jgi:cytochrome b subunit of formate dehydrogenase